MPWGRIELKHKVVIDIDFIDRCKFKYMSHVIAVTTVTLDWNKSST